jgi:hypothetical protein
MFPTHALHRKGLQERKGYLAEGLVADMHTSGGGTGLCKLSSGWREAMVDLDKCADRLVEGPL